MLESPQTHTDDLSYDTDNLINDTNCKLNDLNADIDWSTGNIEQRKINYLDIVVNKINNICKKHLWYGKPYVCDTLVKKAFNDKNLNAIYGTYKMYDFLEKSQNTDLVKDSWLLFDKTTKPPKAWSIICFVDKTNNKELCKHIWIYWWLDTDWNHTIYDASVRWWVIKRKLFAYESSKIKYFTYIPPNK